MSKELADRMDKEKVLNELNEIPFVYTQGREETERGLFRVRVLDASLILFRNQEGRVVNVTTTTRNFSSLMNLNLHSNFERFNNFNFSSTKDDKLHISKTQIQVELDPNFQFLEKPVYALKRHAAGNMGHFLFENAMMAIMLMQNFRPPLPPLPSSMMKYGQKECSRSLMDHHILYLDDVFDRSLKNDIALYGYDGHLATNISLQVANMISKNEVLQLCSRKGKHSIEKLPCLNENPDPNENTNSQPSKLVLNSCFSHFLVGRVAEFFVHPYGNESSFTLMRQLVYTGLKLSPLPNEEDVTSEILHYLKRKNIKIGIHAKSKGSRHGRIIWNVDEIIDFLRQNVTSELKALFPKKNIDIEVFEMGRVGNVHDQVRLISDLDVYITDQGSGAYYSIFMRKDTAALIAPECSVFNNEGKCHTGLAYAKLMTLPQVNIVDYLGLLKGEPPCACNKRPCHLNPVNCDPILRPEVVGSMVVSAIKRRYLKLIAHTLERLL
ncbi:hypothetical protein FDP41_007518 [Naegleria fowleri]|uniref:Glycosyltransferase 61 catalytic domain-containing protein n=1 Tax=Naegleria fowleri TaxID=5763 RepID=A0A6A5CAQ8_NAEFO|nr:uncharacterized protein FDP41_007518 [Naegleria fowleri]KAF0984341.1 hypothetical protein FDP41_007518 [Naegleria fowleri]CAG4713387.1 unnamed protein product [Naegleria fowleri]